MRQDTEELAVSRKKFTLEINPFIYILCRKKPSASHTAYFWFSLGYLLARTLILSLYSASINDEAKRPLLIFRLVPRQYWSTEVSTSIFVIFSNSTKLLFS